MLLSVSCQESPKAALLSVIVEQERVILPASGSESFYFSVDEPEAAFDLEKDVVLYLAKGQTLLSTDFQLTAVERTETPGRYRAVVSDLGRRDDYESSVYLGIRVSSLEMVLSQSFVCVAENADPATRVQKTGLPVLYLDTEGGAAIRSKTDYVNATFTVPDGADSTLTLACQVRGRGNTTWTWPKKPYLVKLDKKTSLLGMPAHKRWILLANFMDRTMMRNLVAMKVSSLTSLDWTPRCQSVELVLNGVHQGNYLLIEQVRVDRNRVNVGDDGYLIESDFHYDNEVQWMDPHGRCNEMKGGIPFGIKNPDPDEITPAQVQYAKDFIGETASILYGPKFTDPEQGYASRIDVASFIDYWIVFEVMGNHELGNPGSVFYHFKPDGKMIAGPCWDFDWGVLSYNYNPQARTGLVNRNACWYARLFEDPSFQAQVRERFRELLPALQTIPAYIDAMEKMLERSAELNFKLWNPAQDASQNGGRIINGDENMSFHDAVARLRTIYEERLSVMQSNL